MEDVADAPGDAAQKLAAKKLRSALKDKTDAPEPPVGTIEPEITATAPEPLFTSTDSSATASRKLDRRRLNNSEDRGDAP
jgi:hypothetical protein